MKTTAFAIDTIWKLVNASALKTALTGGIYKLQRPVNSAKEDVVINALPLTIDVPQRCDVNVNIYVPNLKLTNDSTQPNFKRMDTLAALALALLESGSGTGYVYHAMNTVLMRASAGNDHIISTRLTFIYKP